MKVIRNILLRLFGCPQGVVGRFGGIIMARLNTLMAWAINALPPVKQIVARRLGEE